MTSWDCQHEQKARDIYNKVVKGHHEDFSVTDSSLVVNCQWPYMGASPDGIIKCKCYGKGVLEIKCPFCHKEASIKDAALDKDFCLKQQPGEEQFQLDTQHAYYFQVQMQLLVCNVEYVDFCVCTFLRDVRNNYDDSGVHIERIYKNPTFWEEYVKKAQDFFKICLLPELIDNWYTRPTFKGSSFNSNLTDVTNDMPGPSASAISSVDTSTTQDPQTYCYYHGPEEGFMIGCDNPDCPIEWFHMTCLGMTTIPKGKSKWYCPDCRKLPQFLKKRKGT